MLFALFSLIAWIVIIVFSVIPKTLSLVENGIMFFCISIAIINVYTISELNIKLVTISPGIEVFLSLILNRNLIKPISIMIFVNLFIFFKGKLKKLGVAFITFFFLLFMDLLPIWTGHRFYTGWNIYGDIFNSLALMGIFFLLSKGLKLLN